MDLTGVAIVASGALFYALLSKRLEGSVITLPIVFVAFGWLIGEGGSGAVHLEIAHGAFTRLPR